MYFRFFNYKGRYLKFYNLLHGFQLIKNLLFSDGLNNNPFAFVRNALFYKSLHLFLVERIVYGREFWGLSGARNLIERDGCLYLVVYPPLQVVLLVEVSFYLFYFWLYLS